MQPSNWLSLAMAAHAHKPHKSSPPHSKGPAAICMHLRCTQSLTGGCDMLPPGKSYFVLLVTRPGEHALLSGTQRKDTTTLMSVCMGLCILSPAWLCPNRRRLSPSRCKEQSTHIPAMALTWPAHNQPASVHTNTMCKDLATVHML